MLNNILISRETRKVLSKDNRFIGIEGENLQEILVFNLDEKLDGQGIIEVQFMDKTKGFIEVEKTERGYELPVKSSLLTQRGSIEMQLRIIQEGQEIFKSEITTFLINEAINATATIPEQYPTWIDNLEALKLELEKAEESRASAEQSRASAEKQRAETFNQMGQAVDNAIGNIEDLQEEYNANAKKKTEEFDTHVVTQTENIDKHVEDKITEYDEHTEELTNRLDGIDEKDIDQDKLIENLKTQIINLETENENIKNQFPTGEAEGENITLEDSADMEFKELRIGGNSWQETRSGRNLFDASKIPTDVGIVVEDKGRTIKMPIATEGNGGRSTGKKLSGLCPNLKVGDVVNLHFNRSLQGNNNNNIIYIIGADSPEWGNGTNRTITQKDLDGLVVLYGNRFVSGETEQCILTDFSIMLASETDTSWEQFGQMPSPEFRSEIRNVGDNVNEFDVSKIELNKTWNNTKSDGRAINFIEVKPNTAYTISCKDWKDLYCDLVCLTEKGVSSYEKETGWFNSDTYAITTTENTKVLGVHFKYTSAGNIVMTENMFKDVEIKLEKGFKATPYSPYNCGNFNETVCNGNLFDSKIMTNNDSLTTIKEDGTIILQNNSNPVGYKSALHTLKELCPSLKVGDKAYLKIETTHNNKFIYINSVEITWVNGYFQIITEEMLNSVVGIYGGNNGQVDTLKIMVTLDKLATNYKPHQSQQYTFPLSEGQRMYKDSYLADDGVHHKRGQIEFNGTENWVTFNLSGRIAYYINVSLGKGYTAICNQFKNTNSQNGAFPPENHFVYNGNANKNMIFNKGDSEDKLAVWKSYLAEQYANGTPVIVEYKLAEEVIEPYTEEQQLVYNEIKKLYSYKNVTHIFSTDEIKPIVKTIYRKDLETLDKNKEERLLALENAILGGN